MVRRAKPYPKPDPYSYESFGTVVAQRARLGPLQNAGRRSPSRPPQPHADDPGNEARRALPPQVKGAALVLPLVLLPPGAAATPDGFAEDTRPSARSPPSPLPSADRSAQARLRGDDRSV